MIDKVMKNFQAGVSRVRWMADTVAERAKTETSAAKTLYERSRRQGRIDDIYRKIGQRIEELRPDRSDAIYDDTVISQALEEIKKLREPAEEKKSQEGDPGAQQK